MKLIEKYPNRSPLDFKFRRSEEIIPCPFSDVKIVEFFQSGAAQLIKCSVLSEFKMSKTK